MFSGFCQKAFFSHPLTTWKLIFILGCSQFFYIYIYFFMSGRAQPLRTYLIRPGPPNKTSPLINSKLTHLGVCLTPAESLFVLRHSLISGVNDFISESCPWLWVIYSRGGFPGDILEMSFPQSRKHSLAKKFPFWQTTEFQEMYVWVRKSFASRSQWQWLSLEWWELFNILERWEDADWLKKDVGVYATVYEMMRTCCIACGALLSALWWSQWEGNLRKIEGNTCICIADSFRYVAETNTR